MYIYRFHIMYYIVTSKIQKSLIDDPRINERVTHSDRRGKFLKKMTNRVPLHEKLYYAFVPPHDFFLHAQIKQISKNIWGVDNRKGPNYQNCDLELMTFLYVIRHED